MVWLDVLDITLVRKMEAVFFEPSDLPRRPINDISDRSYREFGSGIMRPAKPGRLAYANPLLVYSRARSEEALEQASKLDPDPWDDTLLEYQNPVTGGPALPTIGTMLQRLRPGIKLKPHRHTGSSVYYVVRGTGSTKVGKRAFRLGTRRLSCDPALGDTSTREPLTNRGSRDVPRQRFSSAQCTGSLA